MSLPLILDFSGGDTTGGASLAPTPGTDVAGVSSVTSHLFSQTWDGGAGFGITEWDLGTPDVVSTEVFASIGSSGIVFWYRDLFNFALVRVDAGSIIFYKCVGGVFASTWTDPTTVGAGVPWTLTLNSTLMTGTVAVNGTPVGTGTINLAGLVTSTRHGSWISAAGSIATVSALRWDAPVAPSPSGSGSPSIGPLVVTGSATVTGGAPPSGSGSPSIGPLVASGTATVTTPGGGSITIVPASVAPNTYFEVLLTNLSANWTGSTTVTMSGGTAASIVAQRLLDSHDFLFMGFSGTAAGSLLIGDTTDSSTGTLAVANPAIDTNFLFVGTSLIRGQGASNGEGTCTGTTAPAYVVINYGPTCQGSNMGVSGQSLGGATPNGLSTYASTIRPLYDPSKRYNVLFLSYCINDILLQNRTAAQIYADHITYCNLAKADGWLVFPTTCSPAYGTNLQPNPGPIVADFNARMVAGAKSFANGLVNWSQDPRTGLSGCQYNRTFFGNDSIHKTDAGYAVDGEYMLVTWMDYLAAAATAGFRNVGQMTGGF